jgi:hypothetical protein
VRLTLASVSRNVRRKRAFIARRAVHHCALLHLRIPRKDDPFFVANAGRMFMLLSGVEHHPPGCPINGRLRQEIQDLYNEAYLDGIDTIAVSEGGLRNDLPDPTTESEALGTRVFDQAR